MDEDQYQLMGLAEESLAQRDWAVAAEAFRQLLALNPQNRRNTFGLAHAQFGLDQSRQAQETLEPFWSLPDLQVDELLVLGKVWASCGQDKQAVGWLQQASRLMPDDGEIWLALGHVWANLSNLESARQCLHKAKELSAPDIEALEIRLADDPELLSPSFIRHLFDDYAKNFDQHLTENLRYHVPELLANRAKAWLQTDIAPLDILDLGCGTGLMAQAWGREPEARWIGIDLSPKMLERAAEKNLYQRLIEADLITGLTRLDQKFDLIFASDVFTYIQDLSAVFTAVGSKLANDGQFLFSVEDGPGDVPDLKPSRRYGHPRNWIELLLTTSGFTQVVCETTPLRLDRGEPVQGWLYQTKF